MSRKSAPLGAALLLLLTAQLRADEVAVGLFSRGDLSNWRERSFVGHTHYRIVTTEHGQVLQAKSQAAASGLFKKITIDLRKTPWLHWSWRVDNTFSGNDERTKAGDDYQARLYVVVSGGLLFWNTHAINYVWSSNQPVGTEWNNAFTSNAKMVAVESGDKVQGVWTKERRNVREDMKRAFGKEYDEIDAIAVMTDSDNTGQSSSALYGDIYFSNE